MITFLIASKLIEGCRCFFYQGQSKIIVTLDYRRKRKTTEDISLFTGDENGKMKALEEQML